MHRSASHVFRLLADHHAARCSKDRGGLIVHRCVVVRSVCSFLLVLWTNWRARFSENNLAVLFSCRDFITALGCTCACIEISAHVCFTGENGVFHRAILIVEKSRCFCFSVDESIVLTAAFVLSFIKWVFLH